MGATMLDELRQRLATELEYTSYPDKQWILPLTGSAARLAAGRPVLDCAIVGGGQFGLTIAFGLARERVERVQVFDANPAGQAGPWMTFARMDMLRTPKDVGGHELGVPSLSFRAWYEAQHGRAGWDELDRIPRPVWMAYLNWYREVAGIAVQSETRLTALEPLGNELFELTLEHDGAAQTVLARTVVLATGAEGSGDRVIPGFVTEAVPPHLRAHSNDRIDFSRLRGKRIGVLGAGASAFDNAATALEAGAAEAHLCFRRAGLPLSNPRRWMENSGFLAHYVSLRDAEKWAYMKRLYDISQPPPAPTLRRATSLAGFHMHAATPWLALRHTARDTVIAVTPAGEMEFDFVIAATGMVVDLTRRPELAAIAGTVALWGDQYQPPPDLADERLARFPYLGRHCEFISKDFGSAPWASRIFTITRGATLSMGPSSASNSNIKYTAPRIIAGVTRQLFLDQRAASFEAFLTGDHDEIGGQLAAAVSER
jgi:cation diffusion facilitator CzcD-associated flavoprotein CzcO